MEGLRQRLARFDRAAEAARRPEREASGDPVRSLLDAGARWQGTAPSGFLRLERSLECADPVTVVGDLDPDLPRGDVVVLDTETTGLESGTGTLVFLVGLVRWSEAGQRLVQLFLPEPAGERAFLDAVAEELASASAILSYNGRGFDVPRLRARMRLHRIDETGLDRPHLDLLFPTRRLVRGWLTDARLKTVEEGLLGITREGDLPGEFAPEVYRALQIEGRDTGLVDVVRHNALDVEHLPRLATRVAAAHSGRELHRLPAACALEVARVRAGRGDDEGVREALGRAIDEGDPGVRGGARATLARRLRRSGDFAGAARCWEEQLRDQPGGLQARVELAKLLEHRLADLDRALSVVSEARTLLALQGPEADPALSRQLDHRYRRLVRRIGRRR